jgi:glycosyltransferase involved in cell wall biosynthesis
MNVLLYSHDFLPVLGGVPIASRILAEGLHEHGHRVTIYTTTLDEPVDESSRPYDVVRSTSWASLFQSARRADVVVANGFSRKVGVIASLLNTPLVTVHQMAGSLDDADAGQWSPRQLAKSLARHYTVAGSFCHVGVSDACLQTKDLPAASRRSVVFNPIDPLILSARSAGNVSDAPERTYDLLFVGRLIDGKGVYVLMDALKQIDDRGIPLSVCIAGSGDEQESLRAAARELTTVEVDLPGALDRAELADVYARSKMLVIPSTTHQEGMPLVIAEALLFGLPVLGSDQLMIAESIGDAGRTFPSGDADALADLITGILDDPELYRSFSQVAVDRSTLFHPDHFIASIEAILSDVERQDCSPSTIRRRLEPQTGVLPA